MITIVIPCYKEYKTLYHLLPQLKKVLHQKDRILLIDDSKNYETETFQSEQVLTFQIPHKKRGYGLSLKQGLIIATYILNSDIIIQMDAEHKAEDVNKLISYSRNHNVQVIIGREMWSKKLFGVKMRRFSSELGSFLARNLLGLKPIHQPTCGFRLFKNKALKLIEWRKIKSRGFDIQVELLYNLKRYGVSMSEMQIHIHKRKFGKSKQGLRQKIRWFRMFNRLLWKHLYLKVKTYIFSD